MLTAESPWPFVNINHIGLSNLKQQEVFQSWTATFSYSNILCVILIRAAVFFEEKKYEQCIEDCDKAVEHGREVRADFKLVAKAMARKGNALVKMGK